MTVGLFVRLAVVVVVLTATAAASASPFTAWSIAASRDPSSSSPGDYALLFDFDAFVLFLTSSHRGSSSPTTRRVAFPLPGSATAECELGRSRLFAPQLAQDFPQLLLRSGRCTGNTTVHLNLVTSNSSSFSAVFSSSQDDFTYVDSEHGAYTLYAKSSRRTSTSSNHTCGTRVGAVPHEPQQRRLRQLLSSPASPSLFVGRTFRIAIAANRQYSRAMGDTTLSVLNAMAVVLARVNGIYTRELGIYFQLVEGNDKLICLAGETGEKGCLRYLPNNDGNRIINSAHLFMAERGVKYSQYDIGHVFTTASGGIAGLQVLCGQSWKAAGTTGVPNPQGDAFSVDFVAHELGHQLGGYHSFRDCEGDSDNISPEAAVEPGSGSTIMGYAGICDTRNLQRHSDAYLHPINLEAMSTYISRQVANMPTSCGLDISSSTMAAVSRPKILTGSSTSCEIPLGNFFSLTARATAPATSFQWDQVGPAGYADYHDATQPRFRSYKPRSDTATRFFPNLLLLTTGQQASSFAERLPTTAQSLTFRFVARTLYQSDATTTPDDVVVDSLGDFAHKDFVVRFVGGRVPLLFDGDTRALLVNSALEDEQWVDFAWSTTSTGDDDDVVEVLVAVNTMASDFLSSTTTTEDASASGVHALQWTSLGRVERSVGRATLQLPMFAGTVRLSFMLRKTTGSVIVDDNDWCTPFDFVTSRVPVVGRAPVTAQPSKAPSHPSASPTTTTTTTTTTPAPTAVPTTKPQTSKTATNRPTTTKYPTRKPTRWPTKWPSRKPTKRPTRRPTPKKQPGTRYPTKRPTRKI